MIKRALLLTGICIHIGIVNAQDILINELMSANDQSLQDFEGDYPDWIELYNSSSADIDMQNWRITDDPENVTKWIFPKVTIPSHSFLILFASGKNGVYNGELHANFKINSEGEMIILINSDAIEQDRAEPVSLCRDQSYARFPDGTDQFYYMQSSPLTSNSAVDIESENNLHLEFSHRAGFYTNAFDLEISCSEQAAEIRYTLDGSLPDENSILYTKALPIIHEDDIESGISNIPTSDGWTEPDGKVFKGSVVRAKAFYNNNSSCRCYTNSYFVDSRIYSKYNLPIVSLSIDPVDMFDDETGIYVKGNDENYFKKGMQWEKRAHFEYFEEKLQKDFEQDIGIRIHGRGSRNGAQKSLRLYARDEYGKSNFEYPFFRNFDQKKFKRLILRSTMTDWWDLLFKDALAQTLVKDMNLESQEVEPVVVFINGVYWGIHFLYERQDEHYIEEHFDVPSNSVDIVEENAKLVHGTEAGYSALLNYIEQHDLSDQENYEQVSKMIDIDGYIDYLSAQFYFSNVDWPHTNTKYWSSDKFSGKWRWFFYDQDASFWKLGYNMLAEYHEVGAGQNKFPEWSTFLTRNLMTNESFRQDLKLQMTGHIKSTFEPNKVLSEIDRFKKLLENEIPEHIMRWHYPGSMKKWEKAIEATRQFAIHRPPILLEDLYELFGSPFLLYPNPADDEVSIYFKSIQDDVIKVEIADISGKSLVKFEKPVMQGENHIKLPLKSFTQGIFFLRLTLQQLRFTEKLIIGK